MRYRLLGNGGLRVSEAALGTMNNLASFDLSLSADQLRTLHEASRIQLGFPYDFYTKELVRTIAYGGLRDQILA